MTKIGTLRLSIAGAMFALIDPTNRVIAVVEGNLRIGPDGRPGVTHGDNLPEADRKAAAERLLACFNACEGLTDEQLARGVEAIPDVKVGDSIDNVFREEDERWTITGKEPGTADGVPLDETADTQEIPVSDLVGDDGLPVSGIAEDMAEEEMEAATKPAE